MHEAVILVGAEVSGNVHKRNVQGRCSLTWKRAEHGLAQSCCRGFWLVLGAAGLGAGIWRNRRSFFPQEPGIAAAAQELGWNRAKMWWIGKALWFLAVFLAIFGRAATYSPKRPSLGWKQNQTKNQIWDQAEERGEAKVWQGWEELVMECPSLGKDHPFCRGRAAAVWRTWLYAVVSDKDSWNHEANLSLYLRMLFCCC